MNSSGNLTIALIAEYYLIIIFHLKNFPALPCDKISPHYLYMTVKFHLLYSCTTTGTSRLPRNQVL